MHIPDKKKIIATRENRIATVSFTQPSREAMVSYSITEGRQACEREEEGESFYRNLTGRQESGVRSQNKSV
jgi:hypothetical protein